MPPVLTIGLFAGAWVDRLRRRPLMIVTDLVRALILLDILLAAAFGFLDMSLLYAVVLFSSICTVLFDSAYHAYLPTLVTREHLIEGNSRLALSSSLAEVLWAWPALWCRRADRARRHPGGQSFFCCICLFVGRHSPAGDHARGAGPTPAHRP